jgi:hypothetical protein
VPEPSAGQVALLVQQVWPVELQAWIRVVSQELPAWMIALLA